MECHLKSPLIGIWESIKNGYSALANGLLAPYEVKGHENNAKAKVAIISCLSEVYLLNLLG